MNVVMLPILPALVHDDQLSLSYTNSVPLSTRTVIVRLHLRLLQVLAFGIPASIRFYGILDFYCVCVLLSFVRDRSIDVRALIDANCIGHSFFFRPR